MNEWTVIDTDTGDTWHKDTRSEAEDALEEFGDMKDLKIEGPGGEEQAHVTEDNAVVQQGAAQSDGGETVTPEPVDHDLPDDGPSISEDPLTWMPSEFVQEVDGTMTITRKGYEVLAHHYDIRGGTEMVVSPVDTGMEYVVHKASVVDADGDEYTAYGEAHAGDNGVENIVRMSDTRAYKRAVSRATGVGTVAIEELRSEL